MYNCICLYKRRGPFRVSPVRVKVEEMIIENFNGWHWNAKVLQKPSSFATKTFIWACTQRLFSRGTAGIKQMVNICGPPLLVGLATKVAEDVWVCVTPRCKIRTQRLGYFWLALFNICEICDLKGRYIMLSFFFFPETSHAGETARRRGCENSSSCQGDESWNQGSHRGTPDGKWPSHKRSCHSERNHQGTYVI